MTREEIDAAIKRHADFELLYDRPYEDKKKVRVSGPFTVESLSPHRSLAFAGGPTRPRRAESRQRRPQADAAELRAVDPRQPAKAGIQNGRKNERLEFATVEPYAGHYLQAVGSVATASDGGGPHGSASRSGRSTAPSSPAFIKEAAREALRAGTSTCCACWLRLRPAGDRRHEDDGVTVETATTGFAEVAGERTLGRLPVLLVRMNADLLMGEDLKKTGAGNLFTVFGEPDIDDRATRRDDESSSSCAASTSTTRPPARCAATTPTRSRCG